jgi:hypothetical protein
VGGPLLALLEVGDHVGAADADRTLPLAQAVVRQLTGPAQGVDGSAGEPEQCGDLADGQEFDVVHERVFVNKSGHLESCPRERIGFASREPDAFAGHSLDHYFNPLFP